MAHLNRRLPEDVELGAVRREDWGTEVVGLDSGHEVRNNRWSRPKRVFEVSFGAALRDDAIYSEVKALYTAAEGGRHSFDFVDWTDETGGTVVAVRFDGPLELTAVASHLDHIETLVLREVFL